MKIAFIGQKGIPSIGGGVERYVEDLATRVASLGHEVIVYTRPHYTPKSLRELAGVKLISLPTLHTKHLDAISHTVLACLDVVFRKVDVVHFQAIGPSLICWLPKLLNPRIKIVSTLQSRDYEHQKWGKFAQFMLRLGEWIMCKFSDEVLVVTRPMKSYVQNKYGIDAYFIPNGSNLYQKEGSDLIKQWGLERDSYIAYIGRLIRHKGVSYLIDAYQQMSTDKKLVIVGGGAFTDDYIIELQAKAGHNPNIIFTGNQTGTTLAQLYDNAAVFVQPSESEGLSLALLEAMGRAKCVLVSNILENAEAIAEAGFTFENRNIYDLASKLQVITENPQLAQAKGQVAQQRITQHYNWDHIAKKMVAVYNKTNEEVHRKSVLAYIKNIIKA
ncbi:MAG: hypothetical protein UT42_C0020G0004 [Candidatus Falkowbacteria bacterium GW2011_GWA2_39_24]|uniref:Glycosyltransferase n=1 Tax=Candidatus Falkowbacteria bacterium GW2011_GWA2_39_24 TaxID=1618634 RepID=A0A0G0NPL4_9BACT|nr:MAG: hypothetical protein UT42_C0020G0004 [Candidatus Falkowbacteria bacterium GW2011_GWA2_39_24]